MKYLSVILCVVMLIAGCGKPRADQQPQPFTGCRISQVVITRNDPSNKSVYNFTYNDDGTVAAITLGEASNGITAKFTYGPGYIIKTYDKAPEFDSIVLDAQGYIRLIASKSGPDYYWGYKIFSYDSLGQVVLAKDTGNYVASSINSLWKNGDMIKQGDGAYFYSTTPYNTGNITADISEFIQYGRGIYIPHHLRTQYISQGAFATDYTYVLDISGKVTQIKQTQDIYHQITDIYYQCM